jgi:hypothetical protein
MPTNNEPERAPARTLAPYFSEKIPTLEAPRWKLWVLVILGIILGNVVRDFLVSKYSLSRSEAFLLAFAAVMSFGLVGGFALKIKIRLTSENH